MMNRDLPALPEWMDRYKIPNDAFDGGDDVYLSDRMRTYGELCRATPAGGDALPWRCFHCDEVFTTGEAAALHFGTREYQSPACQIDVAAYREMEALQLRYLDEDADVHRAMYRMQSEHQQALRRAEEDGYAKGVRAAEKDSAPAVSATREGDGEVEFFTAPKDMHPETVNLIARFASALAEKLAAAERKYGYSDGWASPDWMDECREKLMEHIAKGDPRDVAAYCAFLWHHGEPTSLRTLSRVAVQEGMVSDEQCEAIYDRVSRANLTRDVKSPERKRQIVRAAIDGDL